MKRTLAIVGAGRAGRELARRLADLGWQVDAVVTRSAATSRAAVRAIGAGKPYPRLAPQALEANLILITTPDDAIAPVARRLAKLGRATLSGRVVLHTSGALSSDVLAPLARRGAAVGSMHPMQTFARGRRARLAGVCFAIEGSPAARRLATRLARQLGGVPVVIDGRAKVAYHAAGAFASPQLLAVIEAAVRLLEASGFRRKQAVAALMPLAFQTLENYRRLGPHAAWTGPVSRGDRATIRRHENELKHWPTEYRAAYRALTNLQRRLLAKPRR
jgi:predicted short-subunit dehydrogenase-like oxidoreductase (DUF2520 family)